MQAAGELENMRAGSIDPRSAAQLFEKEQSIRTSSAIWFAVILSSLIVVFAVGSGNYVFLGCLILVPLMIVLMYRRSAAERKQQEEFMKKHFMRQDGPDFSSQGNGN